MAKGRSREDNIKRRRRFTFGISEPLGRVLEKSAEMHGVTVSHRIAFLVEQELEEGMRRGLYPPEWLQDPASISEENKLDRVGSDAVLTCLHKLKDGHKLSRTEAALLQIILDVDASKLEGLSNSSNGDSKLKRTKS